MKQKRTLSVLLAIALLLGCAPWVPVSAESAQESENIQQMTPATTPSVAEIPDALPPALDETTVPEIVDYADAVSRNHVMRLHGEEGDNLNKLVFLNSDGSRTMYLYDYPVKYRDSSGSIRDITLEIADGNTAQTKFETAANSAVTTFSEKLSDGISLSGNGVHIQLIPSLPTEKPGMSATANATLHATAQRLNSKTIEYRYDDKTTIEYSLTYTGFKEDIVVSQYTGQTEYTFLLYTGGLTLMQRDGSYYLADDTGMEKATIGDIIVFTADERNNTYGQLVSTTVKEKEIYLLTIVLDAEYLSDPNTVYPIRIDPTVSLTYAENGASAIQDITIYSNDTPSGTSTSLFVGLREGRGKSRILMKFPGLDLTELAGATITSATVELRDLMCESTYLTMECYPFTGAAWSDTTATWSMNQTWGALLDSQQISYYIGKDLDPYHRYSFDITAAVRGWLNGTYSQSKGIIFKASNAVETGTTYQQRNFASYNNANYKPSLSVTYTPIQGITLDKTKVDINEDSTITLKAKSSSGTTLTNVTWTSSNPSIATVSSSGVVTGRKAGMVTIAATSPNATFPAYCTVYVTVPNGVYYIQNLNSELYLHVEDGNISDFTKVEQSIRYGSTADVPYKLRQTWKVYHLGNGCYSIRPMLKLDMALDVTNNKVDIYKIGSSDSISLVPSYATWIIEYTENGYVFKLKNSAYVMQVENSSTTSNVNVITAAYSANSMNCHWDFVDSSTGTATGVVLYDTSDGTQIAQWESSQGDGSLKDIVVWLAPEETRTLDDFHIAVNAYSENSVAQDFYWHSPNPGVIVNHETGAITGVTKNTPLIAIIGECTLDDGEKYTVTFSVRLTDIAVGEYYIRASDTIRYVDIKNQTMAAGTTIHQWQFHGGNTQKWELSHLGDGTYSIKSTNSNVGYYLGVRGNSASNGADIVLYEGLEMASTRWTITKTSGEKYKIGANTTANNSVIALDTGFLNHNSGDGVILQQLPYGEEYMDEWYFCRHNGVQLEGQKWNLWCWAASARMMASYYMNPSISQESAAVYVKSIRSVNEQNPTFAQQQKYNLPADLDQTAETIAFYLGYLDYTSKFYYEFGKIYTEETLQSLLDSGYPVIISRGEYNPSGTRVGGHYSVIVGYKWYQEEQLYQYQIFDPLATDYTFEEGSLPNNLGEIRWNTYSWICNGVGNEWLESSDGRKWESVVVFRLGQYDECIPWPGV